MGRRMFSGYVIDQDKFLEMPVSAQSLYFHLGMRADDDGFVTPNRVMKLTNASSDDLRILMAKGYVISFPSGVILIAHWLINNLIRKDWYKQTQFLEEKRTVLYEKGKVLALKSSVNELVNEPVNVINQLTNKLYAEKQPEKNYKNDGEEKLKMDEIRTDINNLFNITKNEDRKTEEK